MTNSTSTEPVVLYHMKLVNGVWVAHAWRPMNDVDARYQRDMKRVKGERV